MEYEHKGFKLILIDEPTQLQVTEWERAARAFRNEEAKPILNQALAVFKRIDITNAESMLLAFHNMAKLLEEAVKIINDNEILTLSSNHGVMVKAALRAGWIISPELTPDQVDDMRPPWRISWIANQIAALYVEATTVPPS